MCIPRDKMPQVDMEQLASLVLRLVKFDVSVDETVIPLSWLQAKQCPDEFRPARWLEGALKKPLLVSQDLFILDGHHRYARLKQEGIEQCRCFVIGKPFHEAVPLLESLPEVYELGDGNQHKRRSY